MGRPETRNEKIEKSIYDFKQTCECGHHWGHILVEFQPGETYREITLTCPDCNAKRTIKATRNPPTGRIPLK